MWFPQTPSPEHNGQMLLDVSCAAQDRALFSEAEQAPLEFHSILWNVET